MEILNLSWGHPAYLSTYWDKHKLSSIGDNLSTSYIIGGLPNLEASIRELHKQERNAQVDDKHIVIGNGASQLLVAILAVKGRPVTAVAPYFMRFRNFAEAANVPWKICPGGIELITTPNNPTGRVRLTGSPLTPVYDLCYNWPQYTHNVLHYNEDVMVFSLAKATGHASTRIGWAIFSSKALAKKVSDYIEHTTCGVSIEAQTKATIILQSQLNNPNSCFAEGRNILMQRHQILDKMKLPFKKLSTQGMFLWGQMPDPETYFEDKLIVYTDGELMGHNCDHFRLNLGCSESDFKEFLFRIS